MAKKRNNIQQVAETQLARVQDYKRTFSSQHGKAVLKDLYSNHFLMRHTFVPNDPTSTAFNEGQRQVVLRIMTMLEQDQNAMAEAIEKFIKETNEDV